MADEQPTESTSTGLTLDEAASLFERMDSGEPDEPDADETQQGDDVDQTEQADDDAVVEDEDEKSEDDAKEEEDSDEVAEPVTIKIGDEELPVDEVAKGYLRQRDYTRKTQELAEQRKSHEADYQAVVEERKHYADRLQQLADAIKQYTPTEPDWDKLQQENPDEFPTTWAAWQRHQKQLETLENARKAAVEAVTKDQVKHVEALLESERAKLVEAIPQWKDAAVAEKERGALFDYAQKAGGFTEAELDSVYDHRVLVLLRKAYLYDQGQQKKPQVKAKIEAVKAATPGPANQKRKEPVPAREQARQRLAKTGSIRDAADLFEQMDD